MKLVGRTAELAGLGRLVAEAVSGAGSVVVLEGPAGIGKSTLLDAADQLGSAQGMTVARGCADELDQISPWSSLVRAFLSADPPILDRSRMRASLEHLDQRGAVVETFRESLELAATKLPLLILLDDLQWADQATVAALGWLPEQVFSYPVVWLLSRRPLPSSSQLDALVTRLKDVGASHWTLGPLDEAAAAALAEDVAGHPIGENSRELLRVTGGNPLFIVEAIRAARGTRPDLLGMSTLDLVPTGTAGSLQALIGAHLRSLSAPTVEFLKAVSVLGQEFAVDEASELTGRSSAQLLPAIEEAMTAGVLVEMAEQLAFRHDVFRQVLYSGIPSSMRCSLHSEAASVLRRHGAPATRLANQLMIGAEAGDVEVIYSLNEAVAELVVTSPWAAADLAVRLVGLRATGSSERATAVSMAVQLLGWAARSDEACLLGESFLETASVSPATEAEILLGIRRAWVCRHARPYVRSVPRRVLEDPAVPAPVRADLLAFEQLDPMWRNDLAMADAGLDQAAALLATSGGDLEAISVRSLWVLCAQLQGRLLVALERARGDLHLAGPTSEAVAVAAVESTVAQCLGGLGRIGQGLAAFGKAIQAAEASGYLFILNSCRYLRAAFFLDAGQLENARAEAAVAATRAFDSGFLTHATLASTTLIESSVRCGDLAGANAALDRLSRDGESDSISLDQFWATAMVAQAHGRGAVALRGLEPVLTCLADGNFAIACRHPARLPQLVALALRQHDKEAALIVASAAEQLASANDGVAFLNQIALHSRGLLEHDPSVLREAYELSRTSEVRLAHAILAEDLGRVAAEDVRPSDAVASLTDAFDSFTNIGAQFDATRVRSGLRKLGVRKPHPAVGRPDRGWASLTPAELSVARVVGRGLTNRAAANELCVSPDTVNTHLRHLFTKLDIQSRVELVRLVSAHDPT